MISLVQSIACCEVSGGTDLRDIENCLRKHVPEPKERINLACNYVDISTRIKPRRRGNRVFGRIEMVKVKNETFRGFAYQIPVPYFIDFVFFIKRAHLYLIIHADKKSADEVIEELNMIISKKIGSYIKRIDFGNTKIRNLFGKVHGQNVSILGFATTAPSPAKQMEYRRYIVGSIPHTGLPPHRDIFYITFMMQKYGDLTISVTEDCQVTLFNKTTKTKSGKKISVNKNFARFFSIKEIFP